MARPVPEGYYRLAPNQRVMKGDLYWSYAGAYWTECVYSVGTRVTKWGLDVIRPCVLSEEATSLGRALKALRDAMPTLETIAKNMDEFRKLLRREDIEDSAGDVTYTLRVVSRGNGNVTVTDEFPRISKVTEGERGISNENGGNFKVTGPFMEIS